MKKEYIIPSAEVLLPPEEVYCEAAVSMGYGENPGEVEDILGDLD